MHWAGRGDQLPLVASIEFMEIVNMLMCLAQKLTHALFVSHCLYVIFSNILSRAL
jgi:hypothetical protein